MQHFVSVKPLRCIHTFAQMLRAVFHVGWVCGYMPAHMNSIHTYTIILTDRKWGFSTYMMDCFFYPRVVLDLLFLGLLYKREEPPGTILPALIHQILNLQYDSSLEEQYTLELREN